MHKAGDKQSGSVHHRLHNTGLVVRASTTHRRLSLERGREVTYDVNPVSMTRVRRSTAFPSPSGGLRAVLKLKLGVAIIKAR